MITLIIVDVQNDFISGTMSIQNARNILEPIKKFVENNVKQIEKVLFTCDWHPYNHCSFKGNGGIWPKHCVQFTPGACIEPKLFKFIQSLNIPYEVSTKGEMKEVEQYGAFEDYDFVQDELGRRYYFDSVVTANADTEFVVCGIAGDYCVKATIENLLNAEIRPKILLDGVASIDGGNTLNKFIEFNNLEVV